MPAVPPDPASAPRARTVLILGASNVSLAVRPIVELLRGGFADRPLDLLIAAALPGRRDEEE